MSNALLNCIEYFGAFNIKFTLILLIFDAYIFERIRRRNIIILPLSVFFYLND